MSISGTEGNTPPTGWVSHIVELYIVVPAVLVGGVSCPNADCSALTSTMFHIPVLTLMERVLSELVKPGTR